MKKDNFNIFYDRRNSDSIKWSAYSGDILPNWIADADYAVPEVVVSSLRERLKHPVFGYCNQHPQKLQELIVQRMKRLYQWEIKADWLCFIPGVVGGLNSSRAIMGDIGSNAVTALPVYPHVKNATPVLERPMKFSSMQNVNGRFTPDFDELEAAIDDKTKMLMLCNPHNPVGTVYTKTELSTFAQIAEKHNLLICSDDIHADFVLYEDKPYRPIASLSPDIAERTITLMAASKTFNIAGLVCSYAIIPNEMLRRQFTTQVKGLVGEVNIFGFLASEAAYEHGQEWLAAQIVHLRDNAEYCHRRINAMPMLSMNKMEATFLAWVNAEKLNEKVKAVGFNNAYEYFLTYGVAVSDGQPFGDPNYFRLNLATGYKTLKEVLDTVETAVAALPHQL
ncbi:MAG: aspartate aminotransferase [Gammaproteobacteria bacterium]|nr:MAG: aspartate aminotransferase [Gammaproteobacteria bacterium]